MSLGDRGGRRQVGLRWLRRDVKNRQGRLFYLASFACCCILNSKKTKIQKIQESQKMALANGIWSGMCAMQTQMASEVGQFILLMELRDDSWLEPFEALSVGGTPHYPETFWVWVKSQPGIRHPGSGMNGMLQWALPQGLH